jgi:Flp pilus assembly protein TadD
VSRARGQIPPLDPGIFLLHLNRARKHVREERFDLARQELELAELAKPNDEEVLNLLSVIEFKRGYFHEAAQAARTLLKENPESPILHSNLGLILFKSGVLGEAEQELRRAIELKPDHVRSHLYLGLLYRLRGKLGLALEHLRFAGAKRVVGEIEETLRRSVRESTLRAAPGGSILKLAPAARPPRRPGRSRGPQPRPFASFPLSRRPAMRPRPGPPFRPARRRRETRR